MADNLRRAIQDINLGVDDEPILLPVEACQAAARVNQYSLIGRALIPRKQNIRTIVATFPRLWGLSGIISGRVVERRRFQFVFPSEELMQSILNRGPWAFNDRMLIIQRWTPDQTEMDLNCIPFWVQIRGIPLQFLSTTVIRHIADRLGHVIAVDFNPEAAAAVEFVRVKINWNVDSPLKFQKNFQFTPGVNTLLRFQYERLRGFCDICGLLTHDSGACVLQAPNENAPDGPPGDDNNDDDMNEDFQENAHGDQEQPHEDNEANDVAMDG
ncbi:uncharacterized protein LOC112087148 [Eutrema salsugineum]|uniref:uncharacterized protein LOC112087148 n=1 Tax=Eutrema salsugineum TaxID=72664 RepID=UPI000CED79C0|nr:uncharacterized protein LOC112087148 [Eutrema salsugineum]